MRSIIKRKMKWKEFFKPTKAKIIISILITIAFYGLTLSHPAIACIDCGENINIFGLKYTDPLNYYLTILVFVATYLVYSIIQLIIFKLKIKEK